MRWPLRNQILLPMTCLMAATLVVVSSVDAFLAGRQAKREIESKLHDVGDTLAEANYPLTGAVLRQMRGFSGADFALLSTDRRLLASSRKFTTEPWTNPAQSVADQELLNTTVTFDGQSYFHATVPIDGQRSASAPSVLHIFYPERTYQDAWRLAVLPPMVVGGVALLLVVASGAMVAGRVAHPLHRLGDQVRRIADGDFQEFAVPPRNDEIADLSRAVNEMARMLSRYEENVRRSEQLRTLGKLGGGIAHQIRNSLTGCRMALDLHRRECATGDDESLGVARQQLELMEEYIGRFLALGRSQTEPSQPFDLCEAVRRAVLLVSPMARHAHVPLETEIPNEAVNLVGSPTDLSQLVVNLLLNAVEATSAESTGKLRQEVRVAVKLSGTEVRIEVTDTGAGPSPELAEQLFEPLVSNKRDGVGLGLSVAKSVAEHHGGRLSWHRSEGRTCFLVELPCKQGLAV